MNYWHEIWSISFLYCLDQCVSGVLVEEDLDSGGHFIAEVEELFAGGDGHEDGRGAFFDGDFDQADGVVEGFDAATEVDFADYD